MAVVENGLLGIGLYTLREAAFYARIPTQTMSRWLFGDRRGERVLDTQLDSEERLVTFIDFIQTLAVRSVRVNHKVPLQKIREAVKVAERTYGVQHPFAMKHKTYLFGDEITIKLGERDYVQISGDERENRLMAEVVELYMLDVSFDAEGIAEKYKAFRWGNHEVSMDPQVRFGEPLISSCGYTAKALWEASRTEGGIDPAAKVFGVKQEEVELACRYYDYLVGSAAA